MRSSLLVLPLVLWACGIEAEGSLDAEGSGGSTPTGTSGQGGKASAGSAGKQGGQGGAKPGGAGGLGAQGGTAGKAGAAGQGGVNPGGAGPGGAGGKAGKGGAGQGGTAGKAGGGPAGQGGGVQPDCQDDAECGAPDACQNPKCQGGQCVMNYALAGVVCDSDNDRCNGSGTCDGAGVCQTTPAIDPEDGDPCTDNACDPETGQVSSVTKPNCKACTAASDCPKSKCYVSDCVNQTCTTTPAAQGAPCNDGEPCTVKDTCDGQGKCEAGTPVLVDDGNKCTMDTCDPATGMPVNEPLSCGKPSCDVGMGKAFVPTCDPQTGNCFKQETQCQPGYGCDGDQCTTDCKGNNALCRDGHVCEAGKCIVPKQPLGASCMEDQDCESNICRQGQNGLICGTDPCDGICRVVRGDGMGCENAGFGTDPKDDCSPVENGCKSTFTCNGQGACNKLPENTLCDLPSPKVCKNEMCK